jgi:hypothetical protein
MNRRNHSAPSDPWQRSHHLADQIGRTADPAAKAVLVTALFNSLKWAMEKSCMCCDSQMSATDAERLRCGQRRYEERVARRRQ